MGSKETFDDVTALVSPGAMLQAARQARGLSTLDVAQRLHWLPEYVALIEGNEFERLRRPAFARGYVRAYARILRLDESMVLAGYDELRPAVEKPCVPGHSARPLTLQRTGQGLVIGLAVLALLVLALWWAQSGQAFAGPSYGG